MSRSTIHYSDDKTNKILRALHNKLRPAGTPVMRVEYIIELLLLRIFEVKLKRDKEFEPLRKLFAGDDYRLLFSHLLSLSGNQVLEEFNKNIFIFYGNILGKARSVFLKNLPQKVQDHLVLIEEVFSNSSFNNNVKNGNLSEIIGLVNDIDEERLLKTDLLGDAIESALSEQGGTKDVGLYRTPDHIRQMMVVMANPDFKDIIFDPACGTGGFLFDSFQYVMEKVGKDENWPSEKAHTEIREYLKKYIKSIETEMPSGNIANTFYRVGISGIEYLGMIRKMAAVNLFIRGLNPANIEQGDSLDLFDPGVDAGTKSVIVANPPFGAELDQPAYPNVWEEYPKTDSTTLFVKLIFNHLKIGGRCAVVVSEGFLTWDTEPAKEMRKVLLEEANLKAIISLPQGVFVSKNGQGAKTSILYFEKGEPTKKIWYYKVTNDGYSIGTNRKEIKGCQIPEVLEYFIKYIKLGKTPPETKNSFTIPVEWIKTMDPRLKERIIAEKNNYFKNKYSEKRKLLLEKLDKKLAENLITKKEQEEELWQLDNIQENLASNESENSIEKAKSFGFYLPSYKTYLDEKYIKKWNDLLSPYRKNKFLTESIDFKHKELKHIKEDSNTTLKILASLDPENALEIDIAREFVNKYPLQNTVFKKLHEILKNGFIFELVPLRELIYVNNDRIDPSDFPNDDFIVLGVSNQTGVFVNDTLKGSEFKQKNIKVRKNEFCYNPYRVNVGSIALNEFDFSNQVISNAYNVFGIIDNKKLLPQYLDALLKTNYFNDYVKRCAHGGVRMDFRIEYMQNWLIPLPKVNEQKEMVKNIEKQKESVKETYKNMQDYRKKLLTNLYEN